MQVTVPPLTFLFSALHYLLYNTSLDGRYEIDQYFVRSPVSTLAKTYVVAETKLGRVRGVQEVGRQGQPYAWFRGIPYAKPPVGELRYEPPEPHEGWEGELDATYYKDQCLQVNVFTRGVMGKEDCLFLNVATRKTFLEEVVSPPSSSNLRPVIFFIHGGLFMFGGANPFGPKYWMDEDVVFVSMNYRLNSFGFFNTGDGVVPGNMGLKDQTLALRWVQENIQYFNGDPRRVMLIGESAGAACVHLHTLSPHSRGLYAGAISLSGTALSPWGHVDYPEVQAREYGEGLGCPTEDSKEMVRCLKGLPAETVARYHIGYVSAASNGKQALFGPTIDSGTSPDRFVPAHPLKLLRSGKVNKTPWISGVNSGDGLVYLIPIIRNETLRQLVADRWTYYAPALLAYQNHSDRDGLTRMVSSYYLHGQEGITHDQLNDTGNMFSDRGFFLDSHDVAGMQSKVAPTYVFYYTYEGVFAMANLLLYKTPFPLRNDWNYMLGGGLVWLATMILNRPVPRKRLEIFHGDEMPLLFNIPLVRREVSRSDRDYPFSRKLIGLFSSFAENGEPDTAWAGEEGVRWEKVPEDYMMNGLWRRDAPLRRLQLDKNFSLVEEPFHERMTFWRRNGISYLDEKGGGGHVIKPKPPGLERR